MMTDIASTMRSLTELAIHRRNVEASERVKTEAEQREQAKLRGRTQADNYYDTLIDAIKARAEGGEHKLKFYAGSYTSNDGDGVNLDGVSTISKVEQFEKLLTRDGFKVKVEQTGNGFNYDGDGNAQSYYSCYTMEISWEG